MTPRYKDRDDRFRGIVVFLRVAAVVAFVFAVVGTVAPGELAAVAAGALVVVFVVTPFARVAWLVARWAVRGDTHFVVAGGALLGVIVATVVLAAAL